LLLPFPSEKPAFQIGSTAYEKPFSIDIEEIGCQTNSSNLCDGYEDFDAESILDEEIEEGVLDSIMGNSSMCPEEEPSQCESLGGKPVSFCYGYPVGLGLGLGLGGRLDFGFGMMRVGMGMAKAFRQNDEGDWWRFPVVDVGEISPTFSKVSSTDKKQKVADELNPKPPPSPSKENSATNPKSNSESSKGNSNLIPKSNSTSNKEILNPYPKSNLISNKEDPTPTSKSSTEPLLKLNYNEVLNAWSDRGSPFSEEFAELSGSDALVCSSFITVQFFKTVLLRRIYRQTATKQIL